MNSDLTILLQKYNHYKNKYSTNNTIINELSEIKIYRKPIIKTHVKHKITNLMLNDLSISSSTGCKRNYHSAFHYGTYENNRFNFSTN